MDIFKRNMYRFFLFSLLFGLFIWSLSGFKPPILWEYNDIARNLLKYHRFSYNHLGAEYLNFCPPIYSFFLACVYLFSNFSIPAATAAQVFVYASLCAVIFKIGKNIFEFNTGLLAAACTMLHPGILFYTLMQQHTLILDSFLIALSLFFILFLYDSPDSAGGLISCAIVSGLSSLSRGTAIFLIPLFALWAFFVFKQPLKRRLSRSLLICLVSFFTILPWTIRNFAVHKAFIFIGAATEECFWRGNNLDATGSSYNASGRTILYDLAPKDFLNRIYASGEMGQKRIFQKAAIKFIKDNPKKFIALFFRKLYYFWWFSPESGILYPKYYLPIYKLLYAFFLLFAFFGAASSLYAKHNGTKEKTWLLLLTLLVISVAQSFFYVEGRHRWLLEPLVLIFSARGFLFVKDSCFHNFNTAKTDTPKRRFGWSSIDA